MLGLLGQLGIIGCVGIAVGVVTAAVAVASIVVQVCAANDQADAMDEQQQLQEEAINKAENRAKATRATQKRQIAANLARTRMSVGSSIAYERLLADRAKRKTAKTNAAIDDKGPGPKYKNGTPAQV